MVLADSGMCCTILVQTRELVLLCVRYIAFGEEVFLVIFLGERPRAETLRAVSYNLGDPSSFRNVHRRPLWTMGREVAMVVLVEVLFGCSRFL